ncbi:ComF family protein [Oceanobacillus saliphilus]|uniref:ComF family protein n=1 Tax=Oceanobacillus saliphilus TaxID=2925834 RepID=UPI00201DCCC7|nr:ComF family protein [Oceanobacillus saliphilus]
MICLWCYREIIPEITWSNLFQLYKPKPICLDCENELELLQGERCRKCSRQTNKEICSDCLWWDDNGALDTIEFNYSLFAYNTMMQNMIAKWKYRGDYILGELFKTYMVEAFNKKFANLKKDVIAVPIPLSNARMKERGFNQANLLAEFLPVIRADILLRKDGEKQSKKNRMERILTDNPFFIQQTINKPVLLVDDIYTTGTTLRHAATLLKENGCPAVYAITLVRG